MSRTIIARGAALAAATMLALTACGGTDDAPAEEREAGAAEAADDAPQDGAADEDADTDEDAGTVAARPRMTASRAPPARAVTAKVASRLPSTAAGTAISGWMPTRVPRKLPR